MYADFILEIPEGILVNPEDFPGLCEHPVYKGLLLLPEPSPLNHTHIADC